MSTAMNFSSKSFKPRPPDKGAFPLDHFGSAAPSRSGSCSVSATAATRAAPAGSAPWPTWSAAWRQLMANEPLEKLGFKDLIDEKSEAKPEKL